MNQKHIYIHIGAPKTATTLLQYTLNRNRKKLQSKGYDVLLPGQIRSSDFYQYIFAKHTNQSTNVTLEMAKSDFDNILNQCQNNHIVISEEGFTQHLMPTDQTNKKFAGIRATMEAIKAIVPSDSTIILSIRNQIEFIESVYKHKIKWKFCSLPLEEFIKKHVDLPKLSWATVINTLEEFFPNRVKVVPFELVRISEQQLLDCFIDTMDTKIHWEQLDGSETVKNESLSDNYAVFMRNLNQSIKQLSSFSKKTRPKIKVKFVKEILKDEPKKRLQEFRVPANQAAEVKKYFLKENTRILKKYCSKENYDLIKQYYL